MSGRDYRPICDVWILARPKVDYHGAYPGGFLHRARQLLGVTPTDPVLHVCGGKVREYPFRGMGEYDKTVDIDMGLEPDFLIDVRHELPYRPSTSSLGQGPLLWPAILADPPYSEGDAGKYAAGEEAYPEPNKLLKLCIQYVEVGGRVGFLHYIWPQISETLARPVALIGVIEGQNNRMRAFSVFEKIKP